MLMGELVVSILMMGIMEGWIIGLTILASTILSKGVSPYVFVAYTSALSSLFLTLIIPFNNFYKLFTRGTQFHLLIRIIILALIGIPIAQNLAYVGLSYSSPIVACVMANLNPTISFLLNLLLRRSRIDFRKGSSRIKIVGTFISILGALSTTFYQGPVISPQLMMRPRFFVFMSPNQCWILGCALFVAASLSFSIWNLVQVETVKLCPEADVMTIASSYTIFGTVVTVIVALVMDRDLNSWCLNMDINSLLVIALTAVFGSLVRNKGQMWCTKLRGPFFVPLFKPLTVPYAIFCGCYFFPHTFHYGSIAGAVVVGMGYYIVMWGMMKEQEDVVNDEESKPVFSHKANNESSEDQKVPLLQEEV